MNTPVGQSPVAAGAGPAPEPPALAALIFDVDGTLADNERDGHRVAFNRAFAAAGLDWEWSPALYGELLAVAGGKERLHHYLQHYRPAAEQPPDPASFVAALHATKTAEYARLVQSGSLPLRPGVARLIREARAAGLRLAVATTTTEGNVTGLLDQALGPGASGWFDVIAAGDVVPAKKPAPDIYHYCLAALGLPAAACLAVEDSSQGLRSALAAGLPTLVTVNDYTRGQIFSGALLVVSDLGEPGRPMQVLAGAMTGAAPGWVDVALLRRLHRLAHWQR